MIGLDIISDAVDRAKLYNISEFKKLRARIAKGERHCSFGELICIRRWISALEYDINQNFNDAGTQAIYKLLLDGIHGYGGTYQLDPNVDIPGRTVVINVPGGGRPYELTFKWSDFIDNGEDGRIRYENTDWAGWNPMLSIDNMPYLNVDVDYIVLETGGFELLPGGAVPAIYEGQTMRAVGYEPIGVTPPPDPTTRVFHVSYIPLT